MAKVTKEERERGILLQQAMDYIERHTAFEHLIEMIRAYEEREKEE